MTKKQFQEKIKSMEKDIIDSINKETDRLFDCGGIDTSTYEFNWLLPKIILYVALTNIANQYRLLGADNIRHAKNLFKF